MNEIFVKFVDRIKGHRLVRAFRDHTAPRWIILLIDMLIVVACAASMSLGTIYSSHQVEPLLHLFSGWAVVALVFLGASVYFKSYACVIRLSVVEDISRLLSVELVSLVVLLAGNAVFLSCTGIRLIPFRSIVMVCALSFFVMMVERIMIKHFYTLLTARTANRKRVMVLGTSLNSINLANAIKSELNGKYEPVGLINVDAPGTAKKKINGFPVYDFNRETLANVFVENAVYAVLFNSKHSDWMRDNGAADYFMSHHITMLSVNRVEEFDNTETTESATADLSEHIKPIQIEELLGRKPIVLNNTRVRDCIHGSCVLVSGACGSIGSEIVRQLVAYKASRIVLVDQAETPMHDISLELKSLMPDADVVLYMGDVTNHDRMELAFSTYRPDYVFHAAAYKHVPMMEINPTEAVMVNVQGTRNMADLALKYGVRKFVMISTDKAVNPSNVMGCTKRIAEIYVQSLCLHSRPQGHATQFITTRFGNVLGSNGSVIPLFRRQIEAGGPVTVTHRDIIRYFMTIPEACSLVLEAGCMGHGGEIYIFDMGEPVRIYDLAQRMISLAGLRPNIDIMIKEVGLRPGEKLYEELLNDKEKTTSTSNDKIMIAKVRTYGDFGEVCRSIDSIVGFAQKGQVHDMIYAMKRFVPEYKSMHSCFEEVDSEIESSMVESSTVEAEPVVAEA